jgi:hypothetical protein
VPGEQQRFGGSYVRAAPVYLTPPLRFAIRQPRGSFFRRIQALLLGP